MTARSNVCLCEYFIWLMSETKPVLEFWRCPVRSFLVWWRKRIYNDLYRTLNVLKWYSIRGVEMCRWRNECHDSFVRKKEFSERNGALNACKINDFLNQFLIVLHGLSHKVSDNVTVLVLPPMLVLSWGVSFYVSQNQNMKNVVFIKGQFFIYRCSFNIMMYCT